MFLVRKRDVLGESNQLCCTAKSFLIAFYCRFFEKPYGIFTRVTSIRTGITRKQLNALIGNENVTKNVSDSIFAGDNNAFRIISEVRRDYFGMAILLGHLESSLPYYASGYQL